MSALGAYVRLLLWSYVAVSAMILELAMSFCLSFRSFAMVMLNYRVHQT